MKCFFTNHFVNNTIDNSQYMAFRWNLKKCISQVNEEYETNIGVWKITESQGIWTNGS